MTDVVPWTLQPQVSLRGSSPAFPGIIRLYQPQFALEIASGVAVSAIGTQTNLTTPKGVARRSVDTGIGLDLGPTIYLDNFTVFWYGSPDTVSSTGNTSLFATDDFGETDTTANRDCFILKNNNAGSSSGIASVVVNGTGADLGSLGMVSGRFHAVVMTRIGTTVTVYVDGVSKGTITVGSGNGRAFQFPRLGCHRFSGTNNEPSTASHLVFGVANQPWNPQIVAAFAANPWGVFPPLEQEGRAPATSTIPSGSGTASAATGGAATGYNLHSGAGAASAASGGAATGYDLHYGSGAGSAASGGTAEGYAPVAGAPAQGSATGTAATSGAATGYNLHYGSGTGQGSTGGAAQGLNGESSRRGGGGAYDGRRRRRIDEPTRAPKTQAKRADETKAPSQLPKVPLRIEPTKTSQKPAPEPTSIPVDVIARGLMQEAPEAPALPPADDVQQPTPQAMPTIAIDAGALPTPILDVVAANAEQIAPGAMPMADTSQQAEDEFVFVLAQMLLAA